MDLFKKNKRRNSDYNTPDENTLVVRIENDEETIRAGKRSDIEDDWEDEYKIYIGKQWDTSYAPRSAKGKSRNFNSQDNYIHRTVQNMHANITINMPEADLEGREPDDDALAVKLTDLISYILYVNKFKDSWKKMVMQFIHYGPAIAYVPWNPRRIGGSGPNRWVGEVEVLFQRKDDFFPDPAILDLEDRLQDCSFIILKPRVKIDWIKEAFEEKGEYVLEESSSDDRRDDEGPNPKQAYLVMYFHKGKPEYVPQKAKELLLEKAEEAEKQNYPYEAKDYRDMAEGKMKGIHLAFKCGSVLLDYIPYVYDDGLYPFAYKVLYADEEQPYGMGEVRNLLIPQVCHNKADEIELDAMIREGLGGAKYNKGAISPAQREAIINSGGKNGCWIEVNDVNGIKENTGIRVPTVIDRYKEQKKQVIDDVSQNTPIQQGQSPGTHVAYATVRELGARADARNKAKAEILENFFEDIIKLIINRIAQFYTQARTYRILGDKNSLKQLEVYNALIEIANLPPGTPPEVQMNALVKLLMYVKFKEEKKTGTFSRDDLMHEWDRDTMKTEDGAEIKLRERYVPDFDIKVKVMDERPTDRNYWTEVGAALFQAGILDAEDYLYVIEEGKLPRRDAILSKYFERQRAMAEQQQRLLEMQNQAEQGKQNADIQKEAIQQQGKLREIALKGVLGARAGAKKTGA
jgi:hypothetical protein